VIPNDCRKEAGEFKQVKIIGAPLHDGLLKRLVWIRHWSETYTFTPIRLFHKHVYAAQITNV